MNNTGTSPRSSRGAAIRSGLVKGLGAVAVAFGAPLRPSWLILDPTAARVDR